MNAYHYAPLYRPAPFSGIPAGWTWAEVPPSGIGSGITDLPVSARPFGVIRYRRELSAEECARWELERVE